MLTPEYLNLIEFNDVVELYNKLNIEITADIIKRISRNQDIIPSSKEQLKILKETNGLEIFNEALEKTTMLTAETKKQLKELFVDMAKEDIQSYEELYEYRNKPFKLSESQYKILNEGLRQTNKTLKNLTNTIAFQSKQAYVEAIDMAYMKVVTGAFDYNSVIKDTVQQLANKGITLKDKKGRNVQLEVAVRRNIMSGIQFTANHINRDIEEDLGCDGYEVTAHTGARPTHAEEQGKQFALNKKDASKYGVGLWKDVESLWEEYNCRHSYFGIILGISEPQYTNKELKEMKDATVKLDGEEIPYYEATQKQRALENSIRKTKRSIQTLEKANEDCTIQKAQLTQLNKQLNNLCNETGLQKDNNRTRIGNYNSTKPVKRSIIELPNYQNAIIPEEKFTQYALNPEKDKNKAEAFERALGYNLKNYKKLIYNIENNINKFDAIEKPNIGYGERYEVLMTLVGENKKTANVKTAWIIDKDTGETRLTSAYVTSKGWRKNKNDN